MAGLNYVELIQQGWIATYPLILSSIIMVGVLAERLFILKYLVSSTKEVTSLVVPPLSKGDFDSALTVCSRYKKSISARIYHTLLSEGNGKTLSEVSDQLDEKRFEEVYELRQHIWVLGTIASSAPFIGLFGTVVGIIKSFRNMAVMGTGGFSVVAGGISEALVATAAGLMVAIIAVIAYNYLQVKVAAINTVLKINSGKFLEAFKEGRKSNGIREDG